VKLCDVTLEAPEENLACDEALLDLCEAGQADELLRFWEPQQYFVVLGYANQAEREANLPFCRANGIPVLRRCTGGGTVLQGPGVLNYTLVLRFDHASPLHSISAANEFILKRHQNALAPLIGTGLVGCSPFRVLGDADTLKGGHPTIQRQGQTDLAIGGLKFSGNAQRRHRHCLIFHGVFLLNLDISLVEQALPLPSREPDYRAGRSHSDFLLNVKLPPPLLKSALCDAWQAHQQFAEIPFGHIQRLAREKYALNDWNFKF
jgi:lipoate---protein ligase